jgi:hypothetical protein
MQCLFCKKESEREWHLDCFDDQIIKEFGFDIYNLLLERAAIPKPEKRVMPDFVEQLIKEGVTEGKRHMTRIKLFYFLKIFDVDDKIIAEKLWRFNSNCRPPEEYERVKYHVKYLIRRGEEIKGADGSD